MEAESKISDMLINLLTITLSLYIIYYIVIPWLFPKKKGCGCGDGKAIDVLKDFDGSKFNPSDKACLAVGLCTSKVPIPVEVIHRWKENVIEKANKIFSVKKSPSKKPTPRKGRK